MELPTDHPLEGVSVAALEETLAVAARCCWGLCAPQPAYPQLQQVIDSGKIPYRGDANRSDGGVAGLKDEVRYRVFEKFGYFVTESSEHFSEYVPWFIKRDRDDLIRNYEIPLDEYLTRCEHQLDGWHELRKDLENPDHPLEVERSDEYGAMIIHSMVTDEPSVIYGNVKNNGLIDNLPDDCIVEVPCEVTETGIAPEAAGRLPVQLAALMQTNINVQALTVEAALTGSREHVYHAAMLDPLTAAVLSLDEICLMVDELLDAHGDYIPENLRA